MELLFIQIFDRSLLCAYFGVEDSLRIFAHLSFAILFATRKVVSPGVTKPKSMNEDFIVLSDE